MTYPLAREGDSLHTPRLRRTVAAADARIEPRKSGGNLLIALLSGGFGRVGRVANQVGLFSLYSGLILVCLPALRLPGGLGTLADPFLLLSLLCALLSSAQGRSIRISHFRVHAIGLALFVFGIALSTLLESPSPWQSLANLSKFIFTTSATFLSCALLLERERQVRAALGCWVVSAALTSTVALLQFWLGGSIPGVSDSSWGRMAGLSGNPNGLGAVAGMVIAAGLSLAARGNWLERVLWLGLTLICLFGVMTSVSRAGAVVAAASLLVWAGMHYRLNRQFTSLVAGCFLVVGLLTAILDLQSGQRSIYGRLTNAVSNTERDNAIQTRLLGYDVALDEAQRNPLVGVGLASEDLVVYGHQVHNMLLMVLHAGGIFAVVGIIVIIADVAYKAFQTYVQSRRQEIQAIAIALFAGITGMALSAMVGPLLFQREKWIPAALSIALYSINRRRRAHAVRSKSQRAVAAHPSQRRSYQK